MKRSKRYREILGKIKKKEYYSLTEAVKTLKELANARFNESVDVAIKLGSDPKKQDQMVRGSVLLPYGTGKETKVLVITKGEKEKEAKEAGADYVGFEEYIEKIKSGWLDFDVLVATPDAMPEVSKIGKILGPKGLMPSPKTGTVTFDIASTVKNLKAGKIQFRMDKTGNIHALIGKVSFESEKLEKNILALISELIKIKPPTIKGQYIRSCYLSSTMGPSFRLDVKELVEIARRES